MHKAGCTLLKAQGSLRQEVELHAVHLEDGIVQLCKVLSALRGIRQPEHRVRAHEGIDNHVLHCIGLPALRRLTSGNRDLAFAVLECLSLPKVC